MSVKRQAARALVVLALTVSSGIAQEAGGRRPELWIHYLTNLAVDKNVDHLESILRRGSKVGYSKLLLYDSKFAKLGEMDRHYFGNVDRVKRIASDLGFEVVPGLFPIGYSNDLLWHDPNLAEGLPVRDALFVVSQGEARLQADPPVAFRPKFDWKDESVAVEGTLATVRDNPKSARMSQSFTVSRFRAYHVSVKIRTENYSGHPEIKAIGDSRELQFQYLGVERNQEWKEHHVVFNSLDHDRVAVVLGVWGKADGTLQWKDWSIEELGPVNVLRRDGAPFVVQGYTEGRDFEKVMDPLLGRAGNRGSYEAWHAPPKIRTSLPDGTRLRVSWYHPAIIHDGQVMCCPSEAKTLELLKDHAKRVKELWKASSYLMSFDEIRTLNWDASCCSREIDAGQILARTARECAKELAGMTVYVWNDMFDPHHNAVDHYFLVRGNLAGDWEGLESGMIVANWNFGKRESSLKFFADRGNRQLIAGYFDGPPDRVKEWIASAAKVQGVTGIMYTTWKNKWEDLESFARAVAGN